MNFGWVIRRILVIVMVNDLANCRRCGMYVGTEITADGELLAYCACSNRYFDSEIPDTWYTGNDLSTTESDQS